MSRIDSYIDSAVHHAVQFERYKTGKARKLIKYVRHTNKKIADYVRGHSFETKKQYAEGARTVKAYTRELTESLYRILQKDIKSLITAESVFTAETSPKPLSVPENQDRLFNDILFDTFSDTDTIESYLAGLGERIFKLWDGQFRTAYMTGIDSKAIIASVLGD